MVSRRTVARGPAAGKVGQVRVVVLRLGRTARSGWSVVLVRWMPFWGMSYHSGVPAESL